MFRVLAIAVVSMMMMGSNFVFAAPKKDPNKGKSVAMNKGSAERRVSIREYRELERAIDKLSDENKALVLQTLSDPNILNAVQQKAREDSSKKDEGSSSEKKGDPKK
ncbi:hypothetical protein lam_687 [Candidatus Liberibacter americanus str. Sao Paulo]|uniref:Uncharacterized protein n=1 Tax=Candidatus Liberibacter americanus str. Sao Paulo TaxID=1261131 RepID=U6B5J1_9HYPH|nr:hypothetical protein [Candidatus Liberibacter americanus]AHA28033.1 hypothetical protein lam_687 [Candidatus Liberibacter americanus str. Sao Paulo]